PRHLPSLPTRRSSDLSHLSAHGGIHLGQQGGGNLDKIHAPQDSSGGKARQIAHHAAAQSRNGVGAGESEVQQLPIEVTEHLHGLDRKSTRLNSSHVSI